MKRILIFDTRIKRSTVPIELWIDFFGIPVKNNDKIYNLWISR